MPPQQSFPSGPGPQQPPQPQMPQNPQGPQYGYGASPQFQPQAQPQIQQHPSGPYEVVPPLQPNPSGSHSGHNPYEFIVTPGAVGPGVKALNLTSGNFLLKMGLLLGGVVVLLIIVGVVISSLAPKGSVPGLISITQRQQELIRVSTGATTQTQSQDAQNFVANVEASMTTSQANILSFLTAHGTKVGTKELALDQDSQTDTELATAATANDYDRAVTEQLSGQLQTYDALLQQAFSQSSSPTVKQMLQVDYNQSQLLLKQAKNLENELDN